MKKVSFLFLVILTFTLFGVVNVSAKSCPSNNTYYKYYLFASVNGEDVWKTFYSGGANYNKAYSSGTFTHAEYYKYPADAVVVDQGKLTFQRSGEDGDYENYWTLKQFYNYYLAWNTDHPSLSETANSKSTFIKNIKWNMNALTEGGTLKLIQSDNAFTIPGTTFSARRSNLINHTVLADYDVTVNKLDLKTSTAEFLVKRRLTSTQLAEAKAISGDNGLALTYDSGQTYNQFFSPGVYWVKWTGNCKYDVTINYVDKNTDTVLDRYTEKSVAPDYTKTINSRSIENCKLVNSSESTVSVSINKDDFTKTVYYECTKIPENLPIDDIDVATTEKPATSTKDTKTTSNPKTGVSNLIYVAVPMILATGGIIYLKLKHKDEDLI